MEIPSLPELLRQFALHTASPAVIEAGAYRTREFGYGQLIGQAEALAQELRRHLAQESTAAPEDQTTAHSPRPTAQAADGPARCLIWGASGAGWLVAFWGCVLAGVVAVPFDAGFSREYAERVRQHTGARFCISDGAAGHTLEARHFAASWSFEQLLALPAMGAPAAAAVPAPATLLEIVYTSGSSAEPKGVMITHGNLLANLRPIAKEIEKYGFWERRFRPLGFLHLIPLSHLFGQVMGAFIPGLLGATVVFTDAATPAAWADLIHRRRISVLIAVPRQVRLFSSWALREAAPRPEPNPTGQIEPRWDETTARQMILAASATSARWLGKSMLGGIARRWWRWRRLHRKLGWKFWALIAGGAALPVEDEELWHALGYAVVQGYGLTETAPALAITHPFKIRRGAVGRKLAGVELKIAPDGEILARGGNVSPGYFRNQSATAETFADGWLHTGDLGRFDAEGNLIFVGRKKDVIVSAEGMNIYPQEVEAELEREPEIKEAAVVAEPSSRGRSAAHAVLAPAPGTEADALDRAFNRANARLEAHQRLLRYSIWPEAQLPRTLSTHKLRRNEIAAWLVGNVNPSAGAAPTGNQTARLDPEGRPAPLAYGWRGFFMEHLELPASRLRPEARLQQDLGLTSLDRAELLAWLEQHGYSYLDEGSLAAAVTLADLERLLANNTAVLTPAGTGARQDSAALSPSSAAPVLAAYQYPRWPESRAVQGLRRLLIPGVILPALRTRVKVQVTGVEQLTALARPVLLIANHQSLLDAPVILRALPAGWRRWLAPLMSPDHFRAAFAATAPGAARRRARRQLALTQLFFHAALLSERIGVQKAVHHAGRLADAGYCPLLFPEGARTPDGRLRAFRGGVGVFVKALQLPVVPVWVEGLFEILPAGAEHARKGTARVSFGPAMRFDAGESAGEITHRLEEFFQAWQRQ